VYARLLTRSFRAKARPGQRRDEPPVGLAVATILEAILWNEGRVRPVSSLLA
jgi:hypothetical protein